MSCGKVAGAAFAAPAPLVVSARGFAPSRLVFLLPLTVPPILMHSRLRGVGVFAAAHRPSFVGSSLYNMFMRSLVQPFRAGGTLPAVGRGPRPNLRRSGGPRPFSLHPAPSGRAPRRGSGQGRAVSRLKGGAFLSATAWFCEYQNNGSKLEPFFSSATVFQFCPIILIFE